MNNEALKSTPNEILAKLDLISNKLEIQNKLNRAKLCVSAGIINVEALSTITGLGKQTIHQKTCKGQIKYCKPFGKELYFALDDLRSDFLKNKTATEAEIQEEASKYIKQDKRLSNL